MNKETLKTICEEKNLNFDDVVYNCGHEIENLKLHKGKIYTPYLKGAFNKPIFKYTSEYELILEDCI